MQRYRQTPQSRRKSVYQEKEYVIPRLFLSVDLRIKQQNLIKFASKQQIDELTYVKRNLDYKTTERSLGQIENNSVSDEILKAFEVKVKIKFTKTKQKLISIKNNEFERDYKVVKFPFKLKEQTQNEIELSKKLQNILLSSYN